MKYTCTAILATCLLWTGAARAEEILRADSVIEATTEVMSEGKPAPERDEFEGQPRATLTREVRLTNVSGIDVVELRQPEGGDGYGELSVDYATELGREIVRWCPDGSTCEINGILINGTLTRLYLIKKIR